MPQAPKIQWPQGNPLFEVQIRAFTEALAGNGITSAPDFDISVTNSLEVTISSGIVRYDGSIHEMSNSVSLSVNSGNSQDRWDTVALDTNISSTSSPSPLVRTGNPGNSPEPPDISGEEVLLGIIYVPANASSISSSEVLNWRTTTASDSSASDLAYDDSTGQYGVSNVDGALDALSTSVNISNYPLVMGNDVSTDLSGNSLTDSGVTIWNTSSNVVPQSVLGGPAQSLNRYPLALASDTDLDVDTTDLVDSGTVIWDSSNTVLSQSVLGGPASQLSGYPLPLGADTDTDLSGNDLVDDTNTVYDSSASEVPKESIDTNKEFQKVSSNYVTQGEDLILTGSAGTGGITVTIDNSDREEGAMIIIADATGGAEIDSVTVETGGASQINGKDTYVINEPYESITLVTGGTDWVILPNHFNYLNKKGGTMTGAIDMANQALQNGSIDNATLITDIDGGQNNVNNALSAEVGPVDDLYQKCLKVVRNDVEIGYIDNSGSDMRIKGSQASDLYLIDDNNDGLRLVSGSGGDVDIDGSVLADALQSATGTNLSLTESNNNGITIVDGSGGDIQVDGSVLTDVLQADSPTDVDILNQSGNGIHLLDGGSIETDGLIKRAVPNDNFESALEHERNGITIGTIDNSGSDFRFKALNGADAEVINENSDGMKIRGSSGNADFDGTLEIDSGEALVNDLGSSQVGVDEYSDVGSGSTDVLVGGIDARGMLAIYGDDSTNGLFFLAGNSATAIQGDGFTDTSGNSGTSNVYHDGSNFLVENETSSTIEYDTVFMGAPQ